MHASRISSSGVERSHDRHMKPMAPMERVSCEPPDKAIASLMDIRTLCKQKRLSEAVNFVLYMYQHGLDVDSDSVSEVLQLCSSMRAPEEGTKLHQLIRNKGIRSDSYLQNNLLSMYVKCGKLAEGRQMFEEMTSKNTVSWNAMIAGYAKSGNSYEALKLFSQMLQENMEPNRTTFVCALRACAPPACLGEGIKVHVFTIEQGFEFDVIVASALVEMYAKAKSLDDARQVFDKMQDRDVVCWTSMISAYSECGRNEEALMLFQQMRHEGVEADKVIFLGVLAACAIPMLQEQAYRIHSQVVGSGFQHDAFVGNALIGMYAKCCNMRHARRAFEQVQTKDVVSWTALISGYEQQGDSKEALTIFYEMGGSGVKPNDVTFVSALNACTSLCSLTSGFSLHENMINSGHESDVCVVSALIDMYGKCGSLEDACLMFEEIRNPDTVSWNTIIDGLAQYGDPKAALECFEQMKQENMKVDSATFLAVISACNHAGFVCEGYHYFQSMTRDYGITPTTEHYIGMIDILARAGHLETARGISQKLPNEPGLSPWMTVLSACRHHGNLDVAKDAIRFIIKLEPQKEHAYVLLSNIYASVGRQDMNTY